MTVKSRVYRECMSRMAFQRQRIVRRHSLASRPRSSLSKHTPGADARYGCRPFLREVGAGVLGDANKKGYRQSPSQEGLGCSGRPRGKPVTLGERALGEGPIVFDIFSSWRPPRQPTCETSSLNLESRLQPCNLKTRPPPQPRARRGMAVVVDLEGWHSKYAVRMSTGLSRASRIAVRGERIRGFGTPRRPSAIAYLGGGCKRYDVCHEPGLIQSGT
jgi:hypothetical protein